MSIVVGENYSHAPSSFRVHQVNSFAEFVEEIGADEDLLEVMSCPPALSYTDSCEIAPRWADEMADDDRNAEALLHNPKALNIASPCATAGLDATEQHRHAIVSCHNQVLTSIRTNLCDEHLSWNCLAQRQDAIRFAKQALSYLSSANVLENVPHAISIIHVIDALLTSFPNCPPGYGIACSFVACSTAIWDVNYAHLAAYAEQQLWEKACERQLALPTLMPHLAGLSACAICMQTFMTKPIVLFD